MSKRIIRIKEAMQKTGLARSTIYAAIKTGLFPKPIKLGMRSVGWVEAEIDIWLAQHIDKRDRTSADAIVKNDGGKHV